MISKSGRSIFGYRFVFFFRPVIKLGDDSFEYKGKIIPYTSVTRVIEKKRCFRDYSFSHRCFAKLVLFAPGTKITLRSSIVRKSDSIVFGSLPDLPDDNAEEDIDGNVYNTISEYQYLKDAAENVNNSMVYITAAYKSLKDAIKNKVLCEVECIEKRDSWVLYIVLVVIIVGLLIWGYCVREKGENLMHYLLRVFKYIFSP